MRCIVFVFDPCLLTRCIVFLFPSFHTAAQYYVNRKRKSVAWDSVLPHRGKRTSLGFPATYWTKEVEGEFPDWGSCPWLKYWNGGKSRVEWPFTV